MATSRPECLREHAIEVIDRLRRNGFVAYLAGGCVRDELLGLHPKDFDVATSAPPNQVRRLFPNTQAVGAAFGVILVRHHGSQIEVATFRSDGKYEDGRRPVEVHFSDAQDDAQRRDFTINALFLDPDGNKIIDYVGGQEDLKNKILRTVGEPERRFDEDYLRMLRAVRFAARFDLQIDPATKESILHHAPHIRQISPERIAEELRLMLTPTTRTCAWRLLQELQLAPQVLRFTGSTKPSGKVQPIFDLVAAGRSIPFALALASIWIAQANDESLVDRFDESHVKNLIVLIRKTLKVSNDESELVRSILLGTGAMLCRDFPGIAMQKRFLARDGSHESRDLMHAIAATGLYSSRIEQLEISLQKLEQTEFAPIAFVSGDDLIQAGFQAGPRFKAVLDDVYDAQLEGRVNDHESAMRFAKARMTAEEK